MLTTARIERAVAATYRDCAEAVASMKSAGLWTEELDTLIDQHLTAELIESGRTDDEVARLRTYLTAGTTPRANIVKAIAIHQACPRLARPGSGQVATASSPQDACFYWWMTMWIVSLFCIMLLGCFLVFFAAGVIISLCCAGAI
jgi:hypothetical protein